MGARHSRNSRNSALSDAGGTAGGPDTGLTAPAWFRFEVRTTVSPDGDAVRIEILRESVSPRAVRLGDKVKVLRLGWVQRGHSIAASPGLAIGPGGNPAY